MAANIGDLKTKVVPGRITDAIPVLTTTSGGVLEGAILSAIEEYGKIRPLECTVLLSGSGAFDYPVSQLSFPIGGSPPVNVSFVDGVSGITAVLYPYVATSRLPNQLESDEYAILRLDTGLVLRFKTATPTVAEKILVVFSAPHVVDAAHFTPSQGDVEAIADLAAAYACDVIATYYGQTTDDTVGADVVNRQTKADTYRRLADEWRKGFKSKMSGDSNVATPASAVGNFDTVMANDIDRYAFHGRRYR